MTQTELKNLFRSTLQAQRTIAQEYTVLDAIVDFITQALTSGIPDWTNALTFQTDGTDAGSFAIWPDTNGAIRFWKTLVDDNINNQPPTNPATTSNAYWIEVSPQDGSAIKEWAPGIYGSGLVIVYFNDGVYPALYILAEATRPFESTDLETEYADGKWLKISRDGSGLESFNASGIAELFTVSVGGDPLLNPNLTFTRVNKAANLFYAGPPTGSNAPPTFRAITDNDGVVIKDGATGVKDMTFAAQTDTKPPIKFTAGTLLASLTNGAFEYDGTHLYITIGGTRYQLDQQSTAGVIASIPEINTGTNNTKFPTPFGLEGSKYLDTTFQKIYAVASGTDTYTATLSPVPAAYQPGGLYLIKFSFANTGAATLNLNTLGAKSIFKNTTEDLIAGDIKAGEIVLLTYDGTQFQLISKVNTDPEGTGQTTDGTTWVTIASAVLSEDGSYLIDEIWLSGLQNGAKLHAAFYQGQHRAKTVSGAVSLVGNILNILTFNTGSDTAVRNCAARINISSTTLQLQVRGVAGITMNWAGGFKLRKYLHP